MALTVWESTEYWVIGHAPKPLGSAHRLAVPYEAIRASDGHSPWARTTARSGGRTESATRGPATARY